MIRVVGRVFVFLALSVAAFQAALVIGAPWGHLTWGGQYPGVLPVGMRLVAALSFALMVGAVWAIASRAGIFGAEAQARARVAAWAVVAYSGVAVLANAATPSPGERMLWLPVAVAMFASSLAVVLTVAREHPQKR